MDGPKGHAAQGSCGRWQVAIKCDLNVRGDNEQCEWYVVSVSGRCSEEGALQPGMLLGAQASDTVVGTVILGPLMVLWWCSIDCKCSSCSPVVECVDNLCDVFARAARGSQPQTIQSSYNGTWLHHSMVMDMTMYQAVRAPAGGLQNACVLCCAGRLCMITRGRTTQLYHTNLFNLV
jgi:hypothetical protein